MIRDVGNIAKVEGTWIEGHLGRVIEVRFKLFARG